MTGGKVRRPSAAVLAVLIVFAAGALGEANAQRADQNVRRDFALCDDANKNGDEVIAACWRAINSGKLPARELAFAYNNMGYETQLKGKYEEAVDFYERALEIDPQNLAAFANRGFTYFLLGQLDAALVDIESAMFLDPKSLNYISTFSLRARILAAFGLHEAAMKDAGRVIRGAPREGAGYLARGDVHRAMGNRDQAVADYRAGLKFDNDAFTKRALEKALAEIENPFR